MVQELETGLERSPRLRTGDSARQWHLLVLHVSGPVLSAMRDKRTIGERKEAQSRPCHARRESPLQHRNLSPDGPISGKES